MQSAVEVGGLIAQLIVTRRRRFRSRKKSQDGMAAFDPRTGGGDVRKRRHLVDVAGITKRRHPRAFGGKSKRLPGKQNRFADATRSHAQSV